MEENTILEVKNLEVSFSQYMNSGLSVTDRLGTGIRGGMEKRELKVITGLDLELREGEIHAVVGASGSGKSLLAHAVLGILPSNAVLCGTILYEGEILTAEKTKKLRGKELALIPQSVNYLDPLLSVEKQIGISLKGSRKEKQKIVDEILKRYGLAEEVKKYYPFQLSGGMARKVLLATAFASEARVMIADEPTPGLDEASLQEVLDDFWSLRERGVSILMITHDIQAAIKIADRITIFYAGTTLETAQAADFTDGGRGLRHPYTKALYRAMPENGFVPVHGNQPMPDELPKGCLYAQRCSICTAECRVTRPGYQGIRGGRVRCIYAAESL